MSMPFKNDAKPCKPAERKSLVNATVLPDVVSKISSVDTTLQLPTAAGDPTGVGAGLIVTAARISARAEVSDVTAMRVRSSEVDAPGAKLGTTDWLT